MAFNAALHPRGPNGRFTRSYARQMSALDWVKAKKTKAGFKARAFKGAEDARKYLSGLFGSKGGKNSGGGIKQHIDSGALGRANETLRAGRTGPEVQIIDKEMRPLPDGLDLYRSVPAKKFGNVDPKSLEGMKVADAGYFPTTVAPTKAAPGNVQVHVQAPAGTKAAVDPDSGQVVLDHGIEMAVDSVDVTPDGSARVNLVALPGEGDTAPNGDATPDAPAETPAAVGTSPVAPTPAAQATPVAQPVTPARGDAALAAAPASVSDSPRGSLTQSQAAALVEYRDAGYEHINEHLRGTPSDDPSVQMIGDLDAAMDASRLTSDVETYRGMWDATRLFGDRLNGDLTGMEWREDAYVSTTTDPEISEGFATGPIGAYQRMMMRVTVPSGTGGIELSGSEYESEVLLERGLRMRVVADRGVDANGVRQIDVEVVPSE